MVDCSKNTKDFPGGDPLVRCDQALSIPVLYAKASPGIVPLEGTGGTGHTATAALQAASILYHYLTCLFVDGIESSWTDAETRLEIASAANLLPNDNMGFLIVLKYVNTELGSRVHHILLSIKRSLSAWRLSNPCRAPFQRVEEIRSLGPSPIQKSCSQSLQAHWG
jgi:hypothetical protein